VSCIVPAPRQYDFREVTLTSSAQRGLASRGQSRPVLSQEAARLGLAPEELARAAITDLLATPDEEFKRAADRVVRKNEEL
jgi:hypothetical protein